ncbi:MAG: dUTP diphosphatase [Candidatus Paraimprobicoccus trichonymphae]|uniref:dUTP diphosphatase n=1 Tax=Candidatus Paraimprobicoccus trichonymphae TaxID=3033793 RepID=A0AA48HZ21_9FIRM|nr:MAG: dUTP diphosphatase [Candidatus Paraimprobicoccus trichonymphae]
MQKIKIKRLYGKSMIPTKGSSCSAGYDLYAAGSYLVKANSNVKVETGIILEIPINYFGAVFARSGLATNNGIIPANCVGIIDSDYRGEIIVPIHNNFKNDYLIKYNDRIAQLIIIPFLNVNFEESEELSNTSRGNSGFGSTN